MAGIGNGKVLDDGSSLQLLRGADGLRVFG